MKRKTIVAIATALALALFAVPAFADPTTPPTAGADSKYAEVPGDNAVTFNKYLISEDGQDLGDLGYDIEFTYVVSSGQAIAAADDKFEVKAGPMPEGNDKITVTTATFTNSSPAKNSSVQTGDIITLDSGEVYQKQQVTIDFSKVKFPEPGIYRYVLTEQEISGATGINYDTQKGDDATAKVRIVDVYVVDTQETGAGAPKLKIESTVIHEVATTVNTTDKNGSKDEKAGADGKLADKSDGYVNEVDPVYDLHFSKEVKGNQGSRDKYFKYDLEIKGLDPNQIVDVTGNFTKEVTEDALKDTDTKYSHTVITTANSKDDVLDDDKWMVLDANGSQVTRNASGGLLPNDSDGDGYFDSEAEANDTMSRYNWIVAVEKVPGRTGQQLKADSSGKITWTVYLKHGEYIDVLNLKKGAEYKVTEDAEDYKSTPTNSIVVGEKETYWYIYDPSNNNARPDKVTDDFDQLVDNKFTTESEVRGLTTGRYLGWSYASEDAGQAGQACTDPVSGTMTKNIYTGYTNTRDGIIPTGVLMSVSGGVLLAVIAIVGLIVLNRRRAEED